MFWAICAAYLVHLDPLGVFLVDTFYFPKGPSTQYSRTLVPNTIQGIVFGTRVLKYWVRGPSGFGYLNP